MISPTGTRRKHLRIAALAVALAAIAGCTSTGEPPDPDAAAGQDTRQSAVEESADPSAAPSSAPRKGGASTIVKSAPPSPTAERTPPPKEFERRRVRVESAATARLVGLDVDKAGGVERVTFTFADTEVLPTYDVHFVEAVRAHPEDDPIAVNGEAFLEVGFAFTDPNTKGRLGVDPGMRPDQPLVKETLLVENLGGSLRFAIGLDHRARFRAVELDEPTRLVVEVRP
ncbi:MAG TPA: hypothetical protein VI076_05390 [Actinopolymorphaceae bacterium]